MRTRKEEKVLGDFCNGKHNNIQIIHDSRHMLRYLDLDQSRREQKRERETHSNSGKRISRCVARGQS